MCVRVHARSCVGGARKVAHKRVDKRKNTVLISFYVSGCTLQGVYPSRESRIEYQMMEGHALQESEGG